ncbi:hypothetical protein [Dactylococcopsis salina]
MFILLNSLLSQLQPFLIPLCFLCAWGFIILLLWTVMSAIYATVKRSQIMHQVPCPNCQFFTNDYRLKCTVNPLVANTEQAITCQDYCPKI